MNEQTQNLSACLDDDLSNEEQRAMALDGLGNKAHHYQLIGEAMRGQLSELSLMDVSARVRAAIAEEEPIERPAAAMPPQHEAARKSGLLAGLFDNLADWVRPAAGVAVAASVAMIMVTALQQDDTAPGAQPQVVAQQPLPSVRANLAQRPNPANLVPVSSQPNLDRYLQQHSEFAARDTAQGRLPYVRAVGYESR